MRLRLLFLSEGAWQFKGSYRAWQQHEAILKRHTCKLHAASSTMHNEVSAVPDQNSPVGVSNKGMLVESAGQTLWGHAVLHADPHVCL